jgi:hypothetical protein
VVYYFIYGAVMVYGQDDLENSGAGERPEPDHTVDENFIARMLGGS